MEVLGTVLLWNLAPGKVFSVSGIPLQSGIENENESKNLENLIGPVRVKEWLIKGRMPKAGKYEVCRTSLWSVLWAETWKNYKHQRYHFYNKRKHRYSAR